MKVLIAFLLVVLMVLGIYFSSPTQEVKGNFGYGYGYMTGEK